MSEDIEALDQPVITRQQAAHAIVSYFLTNADAGNHAANDELIAELARRQRDRRRSDRQAEDVVDRLVDAVASAQSSSTKPP